MAEMCREAGRQGDCQGKAAMKRHPFLEKSFVVKLNGGKRIVSVLRTDGDSGQIPEINVKADRVFVIRSRVLHKIARYLLSDRQGKERLAYGTGYRGANVLTLDDFVPLHTKNSSRVHVDPDPESRIRALAELDRYGDSLQCLFHSHPGKTAHSVNPSATDLETLRNVETQYGAIGAICNAGGWLQFFSASQLFQVVIVGKGVEDHGFQRSREGFRHLFRLCHLDADSLPAPRRSWLGRVANRPAGAACLVRPEEPGLGTDDLIRTGRWVPRG